MRLLGSHPVRTTSFPSIERWCEVDYKYDRFPTVSLFGIAISNIAHRFTTWIYSILLSRTMNNFAALNMLNIGFIQFVLEEKQEYNAHSLLGAWWLKIPLMYLMFSSIWCIDVHSLKRRTRMRTGHNGSGIHINRDMTWWLLRSARTKNAMRTEWTVRKRGGRVRN